MKFYILATLVLLAAQPLQAAPCDMADGQTTAHSQHDNMHDDQADGMDCCADDPADRGDGCDSQSHGGACPPGLAAVKPSLEIAIFNTGSHQYLTASDAPLWRFSSPPFRPPIT